MTNPTSRAVPPDIAIGSPAAARPAVPPSAKRVFEILVREHADMLTAFLRSLIVDSASVDDLFQETMLVAWRRLGDYDSERPFGPWLRGIAGTLVMEHRRKRARAASHVMNCEPEVLEALERQFDGVSRMAGDSFRDRSARILDCLSRLPSSMRDVVELAYSRGMLLRQIAESLQAGEEAVKKRLQRARDLLAECFAGTKEST